MFLSQQEALHSDNPFDRAGRAAIRNGKSETWYYLLKLKFNK
jgi:hypothetical protein